MATRIAEFPRSRPSHRRRYPWDEWTDGDPWKLRYGEDFDADPDQFRNRLYTHATRQGIRVRTHKGEDDDGTTVIFAQFFNGR